MTVPNFSPVDPPAIASASSATETNSEAASETAEPEEEDAADDDDIDMEDESRKRKASTTKGAPSAKRARYEKPGKAKLKKTAPMVMTRLVDSVCGHSGYLTFATWLPVEHRQRALDMPQPVPKKAVDAAPAVASTEEATDQ